MNRLLQMTHRCERGTGTIQGVGIAFVGTVIIIATVWISNAVRTPTAKESNRLQSLQYKSASPGVEPGNSIQDTAEPSFAAGGGSTSGGSSGDGGTNGTGGGSSGGGAPPPKKEEQKPKYRVVVKPKTPPKDDPATPVNESLYEAKLHFFVKSIEGEKEILAVRGSIRPDDPSTHGTIKPGSYPIHLGFHNRSGKASQSASGGKTTGFGNSATSSGVKSSSTTPGAGAVPTEADLVVKSGNEPLRPSLIINQDGTVPCSCEDPSKTSMNLVHIHNGFNNVRDSVGGMTIHPEDWPTLMQTFLNQYPDLSDWFQTDSQTYHSADVGTVVVEEPAKDPVYRLVVTVGDPPADVSGTNVNESLYEAEYKLYSDDGTGEKEVMTVRGTARPDNTAQHGSINEGTYPLHLGFHKRDGGKAIPTDADLIVKNNSNNLRPCLVVNRDRNVPCTSGNPNKTTMSAIHVHNGFRTTRGSEGCLTVNPDNWAEFIQHFIDKFPNLSDWYSSDPKSYFVKEIGTMEVVRKKDTTYRLLVTVGDAPADNPSTGVNESLYEAEYKLFSNDGSGEKELLTFRGTARPDNTAKYGSINAGTYTLHLGFHKRSKKEMQGNPPKQVTVVLTPTAADLVVKSGTENLRPALIVASDGSVPCTSGDPNKTTMSLIHVHNGDDTSRWSEGCLTVSPEDWSSFMQIFLDKYPSLSDWYNSSTKRYFVKEIGTLEVVRPTTAVPESASESPKKE